MTQKDLLFIACVLIAAFIGFAIMTRNIGPSPPLPAQRQLHFPHFTATQLPSAGVRGRIYVVTDAASGRSCKLGGGRTAILCIDTTDGWKPLVTEDRKP